MSVPSFDNLAIAEPKLIETPCEIGAGRLLVSFRKLWPQDVPKERLNGVHDRLPFPPDFAYDHRDMRLAYDPEVLRRFCRERDIAKLELFGSALRDDFRPDSNVDVAG